MILEAAVLDVRPGLGDDFERDFARASAIIAASPGYLEHSLHRCLEDDDRFLLLVRWETLEAHTEGFRGSAAYQEWRAILHHYYDPFPTVQHFAQRHPA